eukprot:1143668-Amphidinium_carterae.1
MVQLLLPFFVVFLSLIGFFKTEETALKYYSLADGQFLVRSGCFATCEPATVAQPLAITDHSLRMSFPMLSNSSLPSWLISQYDVAELDSVF